MTVEQTLRELVAIDSVSSRSNAEIISYLRGRCESLGLKTEVFPHRDENDVEKMNLIARTSDGAGAVENVTFAGIDKVIIVENGKALEKTVTVGRRSSDWIEIKAGVNVGQTVVVDPGNLQSGQAVNADGQ